jgi:hypothetical protein
VTVQENFLLTALGFIAQAVAAQGFLVWKFVRSAKALEKFGWDEL